MFSDREMCADGYGVPYADDLLWHGMFEDAYPVDVDVRDVDVAEQVDDAMLPWPRR